MLLWQNDVFFRLQTVEERRRDEGGSGGPGPREHVDEGPLPDAAAARHGRGEAQDGELGAQGPLADAGAAADGGRGTEVRSITPPLRMRKRKPECHEIQELSVTSLNYSSMLDRKSQS